MKIFDMGRRVDGRFDSLGTFIKRVYRWIKIGTVVIALAYISGFTAVQMFPKTSYAVKEVTVKDTSLTPVLQRIRGCESLGDRKSKGTHFDKNGQVLLRANTNGSVDVGANQINSVWFTKATELGYDLTKESDNDAMARWIYENNGTGDWSASQKCWR